MLPMPTYADVLADRNMILHMPAVATKFFNGPFLRRLDYLDSLSKRGGFPTHRNLNVWELHPEMCDIPSHENRE